MKLETTLTRNIAELARLRLTEKELAEFTTQLSRVLEYVELLQQVDLRGPDGKEIEPLVHPVRLTDEGTPLAQPLRVDRARPRDTESENPSEGYQVPPVL